MSCALPQASGQNELDLGAAQGYLDAQRETLARLMKTSTHSESIASQGWAHRRGACLRSLEWNVQ